MASFSDLIKVNVAPYVSSRIGVYNEEGKRCGSVPVTSLKPVYDERLYRFGMLSDVHNEESQSTENANDFINALTQLNNKESIEFICISGDLTQYSHSTGNIVTEMQMYQTNLNSAGVNKPVYVTTGNHDCPGSSDVDYTTFYQYAGLSDIAPSSGATASYEVTKTHTTAEGKTITDHFLFLTMRRYEFTSSTYYDADITWLGNKLEEYKEDRCFVITHMFFPTYAGNMNSVYPSGNWLSGSQLTALKNLIDSYPRTIWFSGHSHWKWYLQKYDKKANVYPASNIGRTTGWAVHIPSCASPIDSDGTSRTSMATQSEGAVIDVYENYIDIRAIEFKGANDTAYNYKYIPVAQYRLCTEPEEANNQGNTDIEDTIFTATLDNISINTVKANAEYTLSDYVSTDGNVISIKFDAASEGYIFGSPEVTSGVQMTIMWDNLSIVDNNGDSISVSDLVGVGFYDSTDTSSTNNYGYSLTSPVITSTTSSVGANENYGVQINTSSKVTNSTVSVSDGIILQFTNLRYSIAGVNTGGNSGGESGNTETSGETEETIINDVLVIKMSQTSQGLGIPYTYDSSNPNVYIIYDDINIVTADGTDVTTTIVNTAATSSNTYKCGIYNSSSVYQYADAGNQVIAMVNGNNTIPIAQSSSSSSVATTNLYIQLKGIKYSSDGNIWTTVNANSTLMNGSEWGKNDVDYKWISEIVDDPTTLSLSTSGTNA